MKILVYLFLVVLLFGCIGGKTEPPPPNPEPPPVQNNTQVNIIVGGQTNQTVGQNATVVPVQNNTPVVEGLEYEYDPSQSIGVYFIDVGMQGQHGNAILIKKGDLDVLIDAGPAETANKVVNFLRAKGVDDLEVIISTNADPRQYGGIQTVANNFRIEEYWWSGDSFGDSTYSQLFDNMVAATKEVKQIEVGVSYDLNGMNFTFLNPQKSRFNDINNDAVVTKISDRNFSLLLTSGIQTGAQGKLMTTQTKLMESEIMQAPYYGVGSGTSNIGLFLITAKSKEIIITGSSDDSASNGGSREPFQRLMLQYGMHWSETYNKSGVRIFSNGYGYLIEETE
ncbi:MAG: MBL fold metallo-hydrolase [Candidatus Micrarchaeota archaeon]